MRRKALGPMKARCPTVGECQSEEVEVGGWGKSQAWRMPWRYGQNSSRNTKHKKTPNPKQPGNPGYNEKTKPKNNRYRREWTFPIQRTKKKKKSSTKSEKKKKSEKTLMASKVFWAFLKFLVMQRHRASTSVLCDYLNLIFRYTICVQSTAVLFLAPTT